MEPASSRRTLLSANSASTRPAEPGSARSEVGGALHSDQMSARCWMEKRRICGGAGF